MTHETDAPGPEPEHAEPTVPQGVGPWPGGRGRGPTTPGTTPSCSSTATPATSSTATGTGASEAIVADLDTHRHPFHVAIENWQHDLNIGSIVRTANAFAAETVHIIGRRRWNKRGAMVTDRYQHLAYHPDVADLVAWAAAESLPIIAVDNVEGSRPVDDVELPERCVLLFGQEGPGLSDEAIAAADLVVEITQYGSTRSINASAAAAIVMHEWVRRHARR